MKFNLRQFHASISIC